MSNVPEGAIFLVASTSIGTFTAMLPHLADVRKADHNDIGVRGDVRMGEIAASALVIGVGIIASSVTNSTMPVIASIASALALVAVYESVLKANPSTLTEPLVDTVPVHTEAY